MLKIKTRQFHYDVAIILILIFFVINLIKSEDFNNNMSIKKYKNEEKVKVSNKFNDTALHNDLSFSKSIINNNNDNTKTINNNNNIDSLIILYKINDNDKINNNKQNKIIITENTNNNNNQNINNNNNNNSIKTPIPLAFIQMTVLSIVLVCAMISFKH